MLKKIVFVAALAVVLSWPVSKAMAARHYSSKAYGFRTGHCKRASCFKKHPGGSYVYPLTHGRHRH